MILPDKINIKSHYRILENEYRQFLDAGRYSEAQEALQKMINLIKNYRILFNDPDDRIQILQIRRFMILYREERLRGSGMKVAYILREVANLSTPDACLNESCLNLDTQKCISKRVKFSHRQAKMCIEKINAICTALKIEAAVAARGFDYQQALEKRRMAVNIHEALLKFDPNIKRVQNQRYLEYWYYITEGYVLLLKGQFAKSKEWFAKALEIGRSLDQKRCFPNYFKDLSEIRAHEFYIDAIEKVQSAQFGDAREKFQAWIDLSINQERKNDLRYDNILFFEMVCSILERLRKEEVQRTDWDKLERFLDRRYIARTTWALWLHLQWLRELSFKLRFTDNDYSKFDLQNEIDKVAQKWELFIPDAVLLGEDRIAGLKRPLNLPYFFNIFDQLEPSKHNWQQLLLQNLKNLFLLVADYEYMRYWNPPPEEAHLPQNESATLPSEKMKTPELIQLILFYLDHRSEKHVNIFKNALSHLDSFKSALEENDFTRAVAAQRDLLERMRFLPHVILVKEQEKIPEPIFLDEDNPNFLAIKTTALRFGQKPIGKTIFEGPQNLKIGSYYYLRPRWNVRSADHYRIRHEQFHQSDLPRWINVFFENIFGIEKVKTDPSKFHDWVLQFDESERLLACRLFDALEFYDEEKTRQVWAEVFRKLPADTKTEMAYIGLGHGAKSGRLNPYLFRQGISRLPEYNVLFSGKESKIFRDISEYENSVPGLPLPRTVIFLDDFIGTGGQAEDFLEWYLKNDRYPWLTNVSIYFCVLVGFKKAIEEVKERLTGKIKDVIVGKLLDERDRAFSPDNLIWESEQECRDAEQWVREIGYQLIASNPIYDSKGELKYRPERDALGWHGCQALVAFHHNIPSDSLPIFWYAGSRNGKEWKALMERYD